MRWDASSVMYPRVIGCFGSFQTSDTRVTQPGGDQSPACTPAAVNHGASLFQSDIVPLSAASVINLIAIFLARPTVLSLVRTLQSDLPAKPRHPMSIGSQQVVQPCPLHYSANSWYLVRLRSCASSMHSVHCTMSSTIVICLVELEKMTM